MTRRTYAVLAALTLACLASLALAQNAPSPRPMFATIPPHSYYTVKPPATNLAQWNGSYNITTTTVTFTMVGGDPRKTNSTTTIPVFIIPVKMVYGSSNGNMTFDPTLTQLRNDERADRSTTFPLLHFERGLRAGRRRHRPDPVHRCLSAREFLEVREGQYQPSRRCWELRRFFLLRPSP